MPAASTSASTPRMRRPKYGLATSLTQTPKPPERFVTRPRAKALGR